MTAMFYLRFLNIAPEDEIKESVEFYYYLNLNNPEIAKQMKDHYDTQKYGLRCTWTSGFFTLLLNCILTFIFGQRRKHQKTALEIGTSKHKATGPYSAIYHWSHPEYMWTVSDSRGGDDSKTATCRTEYACAMVSFQLFFFAWCINLVCSIY